MAKELKLQEEAAAFLEVAVADGLFVFGENVNTSSDRMLAQKLQMEFDREYDAQLRHEAKKFNGDSKVSISFENYQKVHPYEVQPLTRLTGRTCVMIPTDQQNQFPLPISNLLEKQKTSLPITMRLYVGQRTQ